MFNSNVESEYESCYFEMNGDTDETSYDDNEKSEYSSINELKKSSHQPKQSLGRTDLDVSLQTNQRQHQQRRYSHPRNEINSYSSSSNQYQSIISSKI